MEIRVDDWENLNHFSITVIGAYARSDSRLYGDMTVQRRRRFPRQKMSANQLNRTAYFELLPQLRKDFHEGNYAVFVDGNFVGEFSTYGAALSRGYAITKDGEFFVKQITCKEEIQNVVGPIAAF